MCDVHDIQWIGESTLRNHYSQLYSFYQKIWEQPHSFIVMNARRCFNLNYIFMQIYTATTGSVPGADRIISNHALPLYAEEFARFYCRCRRFPSILIVDDLVLHGRGLSKLLFELEELIVFSLLDYHVELNQDERYYIRRCLASAVDLYTYAANQQPLLIEDIYQEKLQCRHRMYARMLRSLSQQISSFLQKVDIPNTSYVLSYQTNQMPIPRESWLTQAWSYRGARHHAYFQWDPCAESVNFLSTVRVRKAFSQKDDSDLWVTCLPLFGELAQEDLSRICGRAVKLLGPDRFPWLCTILRQEHPLLQKQRAQLISLILSMSCLLLFLADSASQGWAPFCQADSDIEKIAQNFGQSDDALEELKRLLSESGPLDALHTVLIREICLLAQPFLQEPMHWSSQFANCELVNNYLEDTFYNIGMSAEHAAYSSISSNRRASDGRDSSTIPLDVMLMWNIPRLHFSAPKHSVAAPQKISCMLALMDNGLMSMNFECVALNGTHRVRPMLKAGELATASIPRRLHLMIPALALVERDCWRMRLEPQTAVKCFILTLPEQARPGPAESQEKEQATLSFLKSRGEEFVDLLYDCGQSFNGWNIDLITSDDWVDEGKSISYLHFIRQETEGQEFYLDLAERFLNRT